MDHENYLGILLTKNGTELYITKHIGEGATSFVYLAIDKYKKEFALKLYKNSESYFNEINKIRKIFPSKYIVKLISNGQGRLERGYSYYSYKLFNNFETGPVEYGLFEYLKNGELHNYVFLLKKKFSEELSRKIFFDILNAVENCHESGIIHGDIKLQNIMLSSNFNLKLIDFGFSKNIKDGLISDITCSRYYNAPEIFSSATKGYDGTLSDVFSLGVVLFVLVMGFYPFDKPNITDSRYKFISKKDLPGFWKKCEQKKFLSNSNNNISGISNEFKDLFEKMVCPKPEERINISQIKNHPWLKDLTNFYCEVNNESKIELIKKNGNIIEKKKSSSPKKNKIKYLHKSSFNKEEKKIEKKNENNYDNISNHSDDTNQKISNNSNFLCFHNFLEDNSKNIKKSIFKDIEIKCLKEFTSRKYNIDKILKEQEDDGD
jgi:serine/threonine protein kinase